MESYPSVIHMVVYYDHDANSIDGKGWCVEFSDSETTNRFGTFAGAMAYMDLFANSLKNSKTVKQSL